MRGTAPPLTRARVRTLARAFDRESAGTSWARGERALKRRLAERRARGRLYYTRTELRWVGAWKTPRIRPQIARNGEAAVRTLTEAAFLVSDEGTRLRLLLALRGVGVPVASVLLHFAAPHRYPVYDVRVRQALRRLGLRRSFPPTASGWMAYTAILSRLAAGFQVSLRTLDKALWRLGG
jgi:hypothetical protein